MYNMKLEWTKYFRYDEAYKNITQDVITRKLFDALSDLR